MPKPDTASFPQTSDGVPAAMKLVLAGLKRIRGGAVNVTLPNGRSQVCGEAGFTPVSLHIHDYRCANRIIFNGDIGFADGMIAGEWSTDDLAGLLTLLADNVERFTRLLEGGLVGQTLRWLRHRLRANTRAGAKRNILSHYDLGNAFYEAWLDRSMTYSSALFGPDAASLEEAQQAKYQALAERLELKANDHVLEIGCGWGGFAEFAARKYGAHVTAITISDAQYDYVSGRVARASLQDQVEVQRIDYRDISGSFDKVASIEMFEAVGEKYWPRYFSKIRDVLKPGGLAALQVITIRDDLFAHYRAHTDFIQSAVFPGGMLASPSALRREAANAGLKIAEAAQFGASYARTLSEWAKRFDSVWDRVKALGFDERFRRFWLFYLSYCEAGFRSERTDVMQIQLRRSA